jgi:hypothetical protein
MTESSIENPKVDDNHVDESHDIPPSLQILLDAGYGVPREARPRQEKILAMAKQIANFLKWQMEHHQGEPAHVTVVGCPDKDMKACLLDRLKQLWQTMGIVKTEESLPLEEEVALPSNFSFQDDAFLEHSPNECLVADAVYLSPDAPLALDPCRPPPSKVIIGLLIDRRVQLNRSLVRSQQLQLPARRWPMEVLGDDDQQHPQEPLNVDTILEALQQWFWNYNNDKASTSKRDYEVESTNDDPFRQASTQAFGNHAHRHPARPKHRPLS